MKLLLCIIFFTPFTDFGQLVNPDKTRLPNSHIEVKGNNNTIRVVQGERVVVHDLSNNAQLYKILEYLHSLPLIDTHPY